MEKKILQKDWHIGLERIWSNVMFTGMILYCYALDAVDSEMG